MPAGSGEPVRTASTHLDRGRVFATATILALALHALATLDLAEAAHRHATRAGAFGLHAGRIGGAVDVDASREFATAIADVLDRAVGIAATSAVDLHLGRYSRRGGWRGWGLRRLAGTAGRRGRTRGQYQQRQHDQGQAKSTHAIAPQALPAQVSRRVTLRLNTGASLRWSRRSATK